MPTKKINGKFACTCGEEVSEKDREMNMQGELNIMPIVLIMNRITMDQTIDRIQAFNWLRVL
jgi:hypothetical protein